MTDSIRYFQLHIGDWTNDTKHLTLEQEAIYFRIIREYYTHRGEICKCNANAMQVQCTELEMQNSIAKNISKLILCRDKSDDVLEILLEYFDWNGDRFTHKRCDIEIEKMAVVKEKRASAARSRWNKNNNHANAMQMQCKSNAPNNHKPITNNQLLKEKNIIKKEIFTFNYAEHGITEKTWIAFKEHRQHKKAKITEIAMNAFIRESQLANITMENALRITIERNWTGFKSNWYQPSIPAKNQKITANDLFKTGEEHDYIDIGTVH